MKDLTAKFTFKVPDDAIIKGTGESHPDAGKKIEQSFDYVECENDTDVKKVMEDKKWSLIEMVNDNLKANARSSAYQNALAVYKPSEVSAEDIKARMVRDFIRLGMTEEAAKNLVESSTASK